MKIVVTYTAIYPPLKGASGGDRRVRDIVRGLCQDNNEVIMFIPIWHNFNQKNLDIKEYQIKYIGSIFLSKIPILNRISFWCNVIKQVLLNKTDAVLFYGTLLDCIFPIIYLKRRGVITSMELCDFQSSNYQKKYFSLKGTLYKLGETWVPKFTNINFVISDYIYKFVQKKAPNVKALIIPILVDNELFKPSNQLRKKYRSENSINESDILIAYIGGMWKIEGVDFLIEAFKNLYKKYKNIKLVIAGNLIKADDCTDVEELISRYNLENYVTATGWLDTKAVTEILNASDILVVPQSKDKFNQAGLPTKLAEYSSIGKPIIVSNIGDVNVYFKHFENALLTEPSNSYEIEKAIEILITDEKLQVTLSENVRKTANEKFSYIKNGRIILNEFNLLLQGKK